MIQHTHNIITGSQYTFEPIKENRYFKRLKQVRDKLTEIDSKVYSFNKRCLFGGYRNN